MLRLACGIAIVAFIFVHSPERPKESLSGEAARWVDRTRTEITEAALRSSTARDLVRRGFGADETAGAKPSH